MIIITLLVLVWLIIGFLSPIIMISFLENQSMNEVFQDLKDLCKREKRVNEIIIYLILGGLFSMIATIICYIVYKRK